MHRNKTNRKCGNCGPMYDSQQGKRVKRSALTDAQRKELYMLVVAFVSGLFGIGLLEVTEPQSVVYRGLAGVLLATAFLLSGTEVIVKAIKNLISGRVFDELFLMSIASIGAVAIGKLEEAVGVMVLYRIGEFLQEYAVHKSRLSIQTILSLRPDSARVWRDDQWKDVDPSTIVPGEQILCRAGERLSVDGEVVEGSGSFDTSALTGESVPRPAIPGQEALSGFMVQEGVVILRALRPASESAAARIISLVEKAFQVKARPEEFIRRFARYYTPVVVCIALMIALLPPLLIPGQSFSSWFYRALILLVISCPCALVISIPLSYFAGVGGAARRGILVKGAAVLDTLAKARTVVFDKTGTLTDGKFQVKQLVPANGFSTDALLTHATAASVHSNHPLSQAVQAFWRATRTNHPQIEEGSFTELPGHGSSVRVEGKEILLGNDRLLHLKDIPHTCESATGSVVHVAVAGTYAGKIELGDTVKNDARSSIEELTKLGIQRITLLTGDGEAPAHQVAKEIGVREVHHSLLPEEKLHRLETILSKKTIGTVLYVGDGINDAPVLARSDAGIAMGQGGSDAAIESADVVLMTDELSRLPMAIKKAQKTRRIVMQNIILALGVKLAFLILGVAGFATLWESVIADVGVALLAVLNAMRALR